MNVFRHTVRTNGWQSLFAGNLAACLRCFPFGACVCISYGRILSLFPADSQLDIYEPLWRGIAGAGAGSFATILTYPLDLVRARLAVYNATATSSGKRPNIIGMFRSIIENEGGKKSLFKGLIPSLLAVAPFVAVQQATYDCQKIAAFSAGMEPSIPLFLTYGSLAGVAA